MIYNSRLFNKSKFEQIVGIADDIANQCNELADELASYSDEGADAETREEARDTAWSLVSDILSDARTLEAERDKLIKQEA